MRRLAERTVEIQDAGLRILQPHTCQHTSLRDFLLWVRGPGTVLLRQCKKRRTCSKEASLGNPSEREARLRFAYRHRWQTVYADSQQRIVCFGRGARIADLASKPIGIR